MKVVLFANTDWYLYNFRRSLAESLRDAGHEVILLSPPGSYGDQLRNLGFRWLPVPMNRRSLNPLREAAVLNWLKNFFREERVDLVHGFTIKCAVYGSLAARMAGVAARVNAVAGMGYVFTSRDLKAQFLRPFVKRLMYLALGGAGARLILQNPDDQQFFEESGLIDRRTIRLIPGSGVDCTRFRPRSSFSRRGNFRVLLPARLLWDKGLREFVDAARQLKGEGRAITFLLAGDPDPGNPAAVDTDSLNTWCREGVVEWLGHVDDMPALYASVDAVVLPSYREGLPKGLIEAGACALPLITTDVPGCREVVRHECDGLLVPVRDARGLAAAIARLHDDPGLCRRLGEGARARAKAEFDEQIILAKTLAVYDEVLVC